ncbi:hypothetical protein TURU_095600 [Turdus rufiventris]|nr:hypothetical protein TURU_095600 [Turdus rufiventris]
MVYLSKEVLPVIGIRRKKKKEEERRRKKKKEEERRRKKKEEEEEEEEEEEMGHKGIKSTLSKFKDDTKLGGVVVPPEGWDGIQRDLNKLKKWAHGNLMDKAKCKVLHLREGSHEYQHGQGMNRSRPAENLEVLVDESDPAMCTHSPESQLCPGLHPKQRDQQGQGGDSAPLLCSAETPAGVFHLALGLPAQEVH